MSRSNYDLYTTTGVTLETEKFGTVKGWKPYRGDRPHARLEMGLMGYSGEEPSGGAEWGCALRVLSHLHEMLAGYHADASACCGCYRVG